MTSTKIARPRKPPHTHAENCNGNGGAYCPCAPCSTVAATLHKRIDVACEACGEKYRPCANCGELTSWRVETEPSREHVSVCSTVCLGEYEDAHR